MTCRQEPKAKRKRGAARKKSVRKQLRFPAPPELVEALRELEGKAQAYWDSMPKVSAQDRALLSRNSRQADSARPGVKTKKLNEPRPGSAAAWIDKLCPNGEWRVKTAKRLWRDAKNLDPAAPEYRSFGRALARKRSADRT